MATLKLDLLIIPKMIFAGYALWVTRHDPTFFVLMFFVLRDVKFLFEIPIKNRRTF